MIIRSTRGQICIALILIILCLINSYRDIPEQATSEVVKVLTVIDGDTLIVSRNNKKETVRLIGIDAPETQDNAKARRDSEKEGKDIRLINAAGNRSLRHLKKYINTGSELRLVYDVTRFDKYGRTLAYAYFGNQELLNLKMVADGFAYPFSVPPNLKFQKELTYAAKKARQTKAGLWSSVEH